MRKGVVVCGANGERGFILESVVESFAKKHRDQVIQFSVNTVALTPMVVGMSGIDPRAMIAVNGCGNRCAQKILEKNDMATQTSWVLDDHLSGSPGACRKTCRFDFKEPDEGEISNCVESLARALE